VREEAQRIGGRLEATLRIPDTKPTAIVVIAHPLPTHGGSMRNPLIAHLARAAAERGWYALRFNFRGVGASAGEFSHGLDEPQDVADAAAHAREVAPGLPLFVVGFSFGARMVAEWVASGGRPDAYALLGLPRDAEAPAGAIIVNGENDEFGTASELRARHANVTSIPGADHFFTGKRDEVARVVMDHLALAIP
jgi:hypothetical protein